MRVCVIMRNYLNQVPKRIQMLDLTSMHFQEAKISSQPFCCHRTQEKPPPKAMWKESHIRVWICWECYLPWKEEFFHHSFTVESTLGIFQRHGPFLLVANIDDSKKKKKGDIELQQKKIYTDKRGKGGASLIALLVVPIFLLCPTVHNVRWTQGRQGTS